jgi:hypothetical protein
VIKEKWRHEEMYFDGDIDQGFYVIYWDEVGKERLEMMRGHDMWWGGRWQGLLF